MSTENAASVCYIMKDAAFAAGDKLGGRAGQQETHRTLLDQLLSGWFNGRSGSVLLWTDGLATPMLARREDGDFTLGDFTRGAGGCDGPCFAVGGTGGGAAYERGLFDACISIAYLNERRMQAAVAYDPVHVELFHAVSGLGAYLNGKRISPAPTKRLSDAYVSIGHSALRTGGKPVRSLSAEAGRVRVGAVCGLELCYTACGRVDASVMRNEAFVDYAAGLLVAQEAGAALMDRFGGPYGALREYGERSDITAACSGLAGELARCLSEN